MANRLFAVLLVGTAGLLSAPTEASAQRLSLEQSQQRAEQNYPLTRQYGWIERSRDYKLAAASKQYLPQLTLGAKASYQSDVTSIPLDVSALGLPIILPTVKKDQYAATLDLTQLVYDGGAVAAAKQGIRAEAEVAARNNDVSLYALRKQVNEVYFALLMLQEQYRSHQYYQAQLQRTQSKLQVSLQGGIVTQAEVDALQVDYLSGEQRGAALGEQIKAYTEVLCLLLGDSLSTDIELERPKLKPQPLEQQRPELRLIEAQRTQLSTGLAELRSSLRPTLGLFAQGGYSRPGLNMLRSDFQGYYIAGARLSWQIGKLYSYRDKRRSLEAQQQLLQTQRATFELGQRIEERQALERQRSSQEQQRFDREIVQLKKRLYQTAEAKLLGGTLSATEAMRELTSLRLAEQEQIQHELSQLKAQYDQQWVRGE